jgi:thimet oligopeptidase
MSAFRKAHLITILFVTVAAATQEMPKSQPPVWSTKPDIAAFEKIENDHLAAAQRAVDQMVAVKGARTTENTLALYDEATRQLNTAIYFSQLMQQLHHDAAYRDHATAMTTKVSGTQTELSLNQDVYKALASLDVTKADPATRYYVQRQLLEFHLAGVDKDAATRAKLKKLQDQLTDDLSMFDRNISDDPRSVDVPASELDGMPQDFIDNHKPGPDGKVHITTNYPDLFPILDFAKSDALRRSLWEAWVSRAYPKNRDVLLNMMQTRYDIATLLGYSSWADYNAADKMMVKGENIVKFIATLDDATRPFAEREFAMQLTEKRKSDPKAKEIFTYETFRYSELVGRSQYDFDSASVRPYLPFQQVKKGIMDTAPRCSRSASARRRMCNCGIRRSKPGTSSKTARPSDASISTCIPGPENTATPRCRKYWTAFAASNFPKQFSSATSPRPPSPTPA